MNIMHRKPFGSLMNMQDAWNRFFEDDLFNNYAFAGEQVNRRHPASDVYETKEDYVFNIEVPGIEKDQIDIQYHNNTLTIKAERKQDSDVKEENYHRMERFFGTFTRSFTLPGETEPDKISADLKEGILHLRIPKAEGKKSRSIPINLDN